MMTRVITDIETPLSVMTRVSHRTMTLIAAGEDSSHCRESLSAMTTLAQRAVTDWDEISDDSKLVMTCCPMPRLNQDGDSPHRAMRALARALGVIPPEPSRITDWAITEPSLIGSLGHHRVITDWGIIEPSLIGSCLEGDRPPISRLSHH